MHEGSSYIFTIFVENFIVSNDFIDESKLTVLIGFDQNPFN